MISAAKKISLLFLILGAIGTYFYYPQNADAAISACGASVIPTSVQPGATDIQFTFTVTNNDSSNNLVYFTITRPTSLVSWKIVRPKGWSFSLSGETIIFTGGSLANGESVSPEIVADIGSSNFSGNWSVKGSDDSGGASPTTCTGDLALSIASEAQDVTGPVISSISATEIGTTTAKISWTTDEVSDSLVQYDVNANAGLYPFSQSNANDVTSHAVSLSNLSSGTTYYYQVCSTDTSNNQTCSSENSFTTSTTATATPTSTPTATPTATATSTAAATATPTATPFVDRVAPSVEITTEFTDTYESPPFIEGNATDSIGVTQIDFSIDGGANWLPVRDIEDLGESSTTFSFTPDIFEDGNYDIQVRALDAADNTGTSELFTIVIDRLPPRVGGNLLSLGPLSLAPNENGVIVTIPGLEQRMTLSTVGGATSVDLLTNDSVSSLGFNPQTGLWTGAINLGEPGTYQLRSRAIDGAGNQTERDLNTVVVVDPGRVRGIDEKIVNDGEVTVYVQDPLTRLWSLWNGATFRQDNPQKLIDGGYQYFLPPGTYYMTVSSPGNPRLTSQIFTVDATRPLTVDFTHKPLRTLDLGPIKIPLPAFMSEKASVNLRSTNFVGKANPVLGQDYPKFNLQSTEGPFNSSEILGERAVISFINTWSPSSLEQMPILDAYLESKNISHAIITSQESLAKATVFKRRGKYETAIVADPDGELIEEYNVSSLPVHFFINRRGVIEEIVTGVLNEEELELHLSNL